MSAIFSDSMVASALALGGKFSRDGDVVFFSPPVWSGFRDYGLEHMTQFIWGRERLDFTGGDRALFGARIYMDEKTPYDDTFGDEAPVFYCDLGEALNRKISGEARLYLPQNGKPARASVRFNSGAGLIWFDLTNPQRPAIEAESKKLDKAAAAETAVRAAAEFAAEFCAAVSADAFPFSEMPGMREVLGGFRRLLGVESPAPEKRPCGFNNIISCNEQRISR